jgi:L-asparaginase II
MSGEEIALCCASHAGEPVHVELARGFLAKIGLDESDLKCGLHKPISRTEKEKLLISGGVENVFQNNCVGKHLMMLALCKMQGWDTANYFEPEHPVQVAIMAKISELCGLGVRGQELGVREEEAGQPGCCTAKLLGLISHAGSTAVPFSIFHLLNHFPFIKPLNRSTLQPFNHINPVSLTRDGCGVPIMSMPLKNMLRGYLNLFLDPKYVKIKNAFLDYPYIIGGEDRLDTLIMENKTAVKPLNFPLIAKVGAGGLCIVVNLAIEEALVVKISDTDMKAREVTVVDLLKKLHWANIEVPREIKTLHGEVVGEIRTLI